MEPCVNFASVAGWIQGVKSRMDGPEVVIQWGVRTDTPYIDDFGQMFTKTVNHRVSIRSPDERLFKLAQIRKQQRVQVEGILATRSYTLKGDSKQRYITEILCHWHHGYRIQALGNTYLRVPPGLATPHQMYEAVVQDGDRHHTPSYCPAAASRAMGAGLKKALRKP